MDFNVSITVPATSGLDSKTIMDRLRTEAPVIASIEHTNITGRTPERTGTLIISTTQEVNPDENTLVRIYTDPDTQLSGPWHRVYAQYQEGLPLGHTTYTNPPRQMFFSVLTDDIEEIRLWALQAALSGATDMVDAANAGATTE